MSTDWARPVVHGEIEAQDPEIPKAFYADLFTWDIGEGFIMEIPPGLGGIACDSVLDVLAQDPAVRMFNESYLLNL